MKIIIIIISIILFKNSYSQELYPISDAAANISKNRKQIQIFLNSNPEESSYYRFNYGLTGKITLQFQQNFLYKKGSKNLGDIDTEASYRFLTIDNKNGHFRSLVFSHFRIPLGENISNMDHHKLMKPITSENRSNNYVVSIGNASTYLIDKLAINIDAGFYNPIERDNLKYGNYFRGGLSLGYLVFPSVYSGYDDVNLNLYVESKYFNFAKNKLFGDEIKGSGGERLDLYLNAQLIFQSEFILEFGFIKTFSNLESKVNDKSFFGSIRYLFF